MTEPELRWQHEIHSALLQPEKQTAFWLLCTEAFPHLEEFLKNRYPQIPADDRHDVIIDLLDSYQAHPQQYQPEKASLFAYLRLAANGDMLNLLNKWEREQKYLGGSLDEDEDVADRLWDGNIGIEDQIEIKWTAETLIAKLQLDEVDSAALRLMIVGEQATASYADVLGLADADEVTQRREVKRMKDKLKKRLQRLRREEE